MLEVGRTANATEDRSHFGAWCVVSAPLILGFDLRDNKTMDRVWSVITNVEALAVSQSWAGHPGRLVKSSPNMVQSLPQWQVRAFVSACCRAWVDREWRDWSR